MNWSEGGERRIKEKDKEKRKEEADVKTSRHMDVLINCWTLANKSINPCHNHEKLAALGVSRSNKIGRETTWNEENVQN